MPPAPPPNSARRARGFQAASSLLGPQIRKVGEARGFAVSRLLTHWAEIAGPDIAACARPVKIGYTKGGFGATLTLLTTGPAAPLVQMQLPRLREKVNACYGYNAISRITITQTAPIGFAEGQATFTPAPKAAPKPPDPAMARKARDVAGAVQDDDLRAALERLAANVLSRRDRKQGNT